MSCPSCGSGKNILKRRANQFIAYLIVFSSFVVGGFQDSAASASGSHHRLLWPIPRSWAESGILPSSGSLPAIHCTLPPAATCHLWPASPGHANPHCSFQSHIQEGKRSKGCIYRTETLYSSKKHRLPSQIETLSFSLLSFSCQHLLCPLRNHCNHLQSPSTLSSEPSPNRVKLFVHQNNPLTAIWGRAARGKTWKHFLHKMWSTFTNIVGGVWCSAI